MAGHIGYLAYAKLFTKKQGQYAYKRYTYKKTCTGTLRIWKFMHRFFTKYRKLYYLL